MNSFNYVWQRQYRPIVFARAGVNAVVLNRYRWLMLSLLIMLSLGQYGGVLFAQPCIDNSPQITYQATAHCGGGYSCAAYQYSVADPSAYTTTGYAFLFPQFPANEQAYLFAPDGGAFFQFPDGTIRFVGEIYAANNPNKRWVLSLWFDQRSAWDGWLAANPGLSASQLYFDSNADAGDAYQSWVYVLLDADHANTLTGVGEWAGYTLNLSHSYGNNGNHYAFQLGYGANDQSAGIGFGGSFNYSGTAALSVSNPLSYLINAGSGSISITYFCPPKSCTGTISTSITGGTPPYSFQWNTGITGSSLFGLCPGNYALTATDAQGCSAEQVIQVGAQTAPFVYLGPDRTICQGSTATLDAGSEGMSYQWSTGANTQSIIVATQGQYSVTVTGSNGCVAHDAIFVTVKPIPDIEMPPFVNTCGQATLSVENIFASYQWSNGATTASITVSQSGNYTVSATSFDGCMAVATSTVSISTIAFDLPINIMECNGTTLDAGSGFESYQWSDGSNTQSIYITNSGSYSVTVTSTAGCSASASTFVTISSVNALPSLPPLVNACGTVVLEAGGGYAAYLWSNGEQTSNISVASGGVYSVTVSDGNGCTASATTWVEMNMVETPNLGGNQSACQPILLNAGSNYASYQWSNGAQTPSIVANQSGIYSVVVTGSGGCTASAAIQVTIGSALSVNLGNDFAACGSANLSINGIFDTYQWSNGSNASTLLVSESGAYSVTVSGVGGCTASDMVNVTINPSIAVNLGENVAACQATTFDAGAGFASYQWNTGSQAQSITASFSSAYSVIVTDMNGCTASDVVQFDLLPTPLLNIGTTNIGCGTATLQTNGSFGVYTWSNGANSPTIDITESGLYSVTVTTVQGCTGSTSVFIELNTPPNFSLGSDIASCGATTIGTGTAFAAYQWSNGQTTPNITAAQSGTYSVTVTTANGCTASDAVNVSIGTPPVVSLENNIVSCTGSAILSAPQGFTTYQWSNGQMTSSITVTQTDSYSVIVTDSGGCTASEATFVVIATAPMLELGNDLNVCQSAVLDAGSGMASYLWSNNNASQTITVNTSGTYSVVVTNIYGCTASDAVIVSVNNENVQVLATASTDRVCSGTPFALLGSTVPATPGTILWYNSINNQLIDNPENVLLNNTSCAAQSYSFYPIFTPNNGCEPITGNSVSVLLYPSPAAVLTVNSCNVTLTNTCPAFGVQWNDGLGNTGNSNFYQAAPGTNGNITFVLTQNGAQGLSCATQTLSANFACASTATPPTAINDTITVCGPTSITVPVLNNDLNGSSPIEAIFSLQPLSGAGGTTSLNGDFTQIVYNLANNSNGTDVFSYTLIDQNNLTSNTGYLVVIRDCPSTVDLGSISGFVWNDTNNNGIQDAGEQGIGGATVTLFNAANNMPVGTTTTNTNGNYLFDELVEGSYYINVTLPNGSALVLSTPDAGGNDATDSDLYPPLAQSGNIVIGSGTNADIDAGFSTPQAPLGGSITGFVWNDANNNGIQDAGEQGIGGATVTLFNAANNMPVGTTTTNTNGNYLFDDLSEGTYYVHITLPNGSTLVLSIPDAGGDDTTDSDLYPPLVQSGNIVIGSGTNADVDAGFGPASLLKGAITGFVWNDANNNGIQDAGEQGIAGATVVVYNVDGWSVTTVQTDFMGSYLAGNLSAGSYYVQVTPPTNQNWVATMPNTGNNENIDSDIVAPNNQSQTVSVAVGILADIDAGFSTVQPPLGGSVTGFVWNDANNNGTQDAGEQGLSGATVILFNAQNNQQVATFTTTANGLYQFTGITAGTYYVQASAPAGSNLNLSPANVGNNDNIDSDLNSPNNQSANFTISGNGAVDIDAGFAPQQQGGTGSVMGFVWNDANANGIQDAGEQGIGGITVVLFNTQTGLQVGATTTTGNGLYTFNNVSTGTYYVGFNANGQNLVVTLPNAANNDNTDSDINPANGQSASFVINANSTVDIDAGFVTPSGLQLQADCATTEPNTAVDIDVLANDFPDTGLTVTAILQNGSEAQGFVINPTGTLTYTPANGVEGTLNFTYQVTYNLTGATATAPLSIEVGNANNAPVLGNDLSECTNLLTPTVVCLPNEDQEGDPINITQASAASGSPVVVLNDHCIRYTPQFGFSGVDTLLVEVCDTHTGVCSGLGSSLCSTAQIIMTVACPEAINDTTIALLNQENPIVVLDNDSGLLPLEVTVIVPPSYGSFEILPDGTVVYVPDAINPGTDAFVYEITDPNGNTDQAVVMITILNPDGAAPVAYDDFEELLPDEQVVFIPVLSNDIDPNGDPLEIIFYSEPLCGEVAEGANGQLIYIPTCDPFEQDSFYYIISDPSGLTDTAWVYVYTNNIQNPDILGILASDDFQNGVINTPIPLIEILNNDLVCIVDGGCPAIPETLDDYPYTITIIDQPDNGEAEPVNNGTDDVGISYAPNPGFFGIETITYVVCTGAICDTADVTIQIFNTPYVVANDDSYTLTDTNPITLPIADNDILCAQLIDIQCLPVSASGNNTLIEISTVPGQEPQFGQIVYDPVTHTAHYTPNGTPGVDVFQYIICLTNPAYQDCDTAEVTIFIGQCDTLANAQTDVVFVQVGQTVDIQVLNNDTGDGIEVISIGTPQHGTVMIENGNSIAYTPNEGLNPVTDTLDYFFYTIIDDCNNIDSTLVGIHILFNDDNLPPVAGNDIATTNPGVPVTIPVLDNDEDPNDDPLTVLSVCLPENGTAVINADGTITYIPNEGFEGTDCFCYVLSDGQATDSATICVTVPQDGPVNQPPTAQDDNATTDENNPVSIPVLTNDSDPEDGNNLNISIITPPANGTAEVQNGQIDYTPEDGFVGIDYIQYIACDNGNPVLCDTAWVAINVLPTTPNECVVAVDDSMTISIDQTGIIPILENDSDAEGDPFFILGIDELPLNGTAVIIEDTLYYTPQLGFIGCDSLTYILSNDEGTCLDTAKVIVCIANNQAPIAVDDPETVEQGTPLPIDFLGNDSDPDGDPITLVSVLNQPEYGTAGLVVAGDTTIMYLPPTDTCNVTDSIWYVIEDPLGLTDTALITIAVTCPVNDPPVAVDDYETTQVNTSVLICVMSNDFDPEDDPIGVINILLQPSYGIATIDENDCILYAPDPGFEGCDTFEYVIRDLVGLGTDIGQVIVCIGNNPPIAVNDTIEATVNEPISIGFLGNDGDPDGDPISYTDIIAGPYFGTIDVQFGADTTLLYVSDTCPVVDTVLYRIQDPSGAMDTAQILIYVGCEVGNEPPIAVNDTITLETTDTICIEVMNNDLDPDGDPIIVVIVGGAEQGIIEWNTGDSCVSYIPNPNFEGTDTFSYIIQDPDGQNDTALVVIYYPQQTDTVVIATNDTSQTDENVSVVINIAQNDSICIEAPSDTTCTLIGNITSIVVIESPTGGNITDVSTIDGTIEYSPNPGTESDQFVYVICSGTVCDTATVVITILNCPSLADIFIPNGFSPNDDNLNDIFRIAQAPQCFPDNELLIFNRWGDLVFKIEDYDNEANVWRGEWQENNEPLPDGTYFYIFNDRASGESRNGCVELRR